jgi:hypothetical protein
MEGKIFLGILLMWALILINPLVVDSSDINSGFGKKITVNWSNYVTNVSGAMGESPNPVLKLKEKIGVGFIGEDFPYVTYFSEFVGKNNGNCGPLNDWSCHRIVNGSGPRVHYDNFNEPLVFYTWDNGTISSFNVAKYVGTGGDCSLNSEWSCENIISSMGNIAIVDSYMDDRGTVYFVGIDVLAAVFGWPGEMYLYTYQFGQISEQLLLSDALFDVVVNYDSNGMIHIGVTKGTKENIVHMYPYGSGGNCGPQNTWQCDSLLNAGTLNKIIDLEINSKDELLFSFWNGDTKKFGFGKEIGSGGNCGPNNNYECTLIAKGGRALLELGKNDVPQGATYTLENPYFAGHIKYSGSGGNCGPNNNYECNLFELRNDTIALVTDFELSSNRNKSYVTYYYKIGYHTHIGNMAEYVGVGKGNCGFNNDWWCYEIIPGAVPLDIEIKKI